LLAFESKYLIKERAEEITRIGRYILRNRNSTHQEFNLVDFYKDVVETAIQVQVGRTATGLTFRAEHYGVISLQLDFDDPSYLRLYRTSYSDETEGLNWVELLTLCNDVSKELKAVKATVDSLGDWFAVTFLVETFLAEQGKLPTRDILLSVFERNLRLVLLATDYLHQLKRNHQEL